MIDQNDNYILFSGCEGLIMTMATEDNLYLIAKQVQLLVKVMTDINKNLSRISEEVSAINERNYEDGR
jgi:hypothetical protein